MKTKYYRIDGVNDQFKNIKQARIYFDLLPEKSKAQMEGVALRGYNMEDEQETVKYYHYRGNGDFVLNDKQ